MGQPLVVLIGRTLLLDGIYACLDQNGAITTVQFEWSDEAMCEQLSLIKPALIIVESSIAALGILPSLLEATKSCLICLDPAQNRGAMMRCQQLHGTSMAELCQFAIQAACCDNAAPLASTVETLGEDSVFSSI